jgi:hypothetical protein
VLLRLLVLGQRGVGDRGHDLDVLKLDLQAWHVSEGDESAVVLQVKYVSSSSLRSNGLG